MSDLKKPQGQSEQAPTDAEYTSSEQPPTAPNEKVEGAATDFHDRLLFSTTPIDESNILANCMLEYQQIIALQTEVAYFPSSTFAELRRLLLNVIDTHFDLYKKRFSIPDRLVCLEFTCAEGVYYLSLSQGYLCIYQYPNVRHPLAMPLVWPPADVPSVSN